MIIQHKLEILSQIAKKLNEGHVTWAVGGSLLLYFKGIVDEFHDIDLMGGFTITKADGEHRCFLRKEDICEKVLVDGEQIPLHSLTEWRRYYELMGRSAKLKMIDDAEENMEEDSK